MDNMIPIFQDAGKDFLLLKKDMTICQSRTDNKKGGTYQWQFARLGNLEIYDVEIDSMLQNAINRIVNETGKTGHTVDAPAIHMTRMGKHWHDRPFWFLYL